MNIKDSDWTKLVVDVLKVKTAKENLPRNFMLYLFFIDLEISNTSPHNVQ